MLNRLDILEYLFFYFFEPIKLILRELKDQLQYYIFIFALDGSGCTNTFDTKITYMYIYIYICIYLVFIYLIGIKKYFFL